MLGAPWSLFSAVLWNNQERKECFSQHIKKQLSIFSFVEESIIRLLLCFTPVYKQPHTAESLPYWTSYNMLI